MTLPILYFVRHGETDWNAEGRLQGQKDIPLNPLGRRQAAEAAGTLRALGLPVERFDYVSSPLQRTRDTMELLRGTLGLATDAYRLDARIQEISFGTWEGMTWREVRRRDPAGAAAREADKWNMVPPEGESYAGLAERVAPVLDTLNGETLMVAHGGVARALMVLIAGISPLDAPTRDIWQGRVLRFSNGTAEWL